MPWAFNREGRLFERGRLFEKYRKQEDQIITLLYVTFFEHCTSNEVLC